MKKTEILNLNLVDFRTTNNQMELSVQLIEESSTQFRIHSAGGGVSTIDLDKKQVKELIKFLKLIK